MFSFWKSAVYEIMWKHFVQPVRPHMNIQRKRNARWIAKAINTHSECVLITAFPLQQWLHERASMLRYTYTACLVYIWYTQHQFRSFSSFRCGFTVIHFWNSMQWNPNKFENETNTKYVTLDSRGRILLLNLISPNQESQWFTQF
jgi:hypothetical protein